VAGGYGDNPADNFRAYIRYRILKKYRDRKETPQTCSSGFGRGLYGYSDYANFSTFLNIKLLYLLCSSYI
jgi:hypothetical protein